MARLLSRNARLFVTTATDLSSPTTANTWEVKILDGFSYSQDTDSQEIGVSEAGVAPSRGTQSFNTALNNVDVSFSTYIRPYFAASVVNSVEEPLWRATTNKAGITSAGPDKLDYDFSASDANEIQKLQLYFYYGNTTYKVGDCSLTTAEVDYSIDAIASVAWTGIGASLDEDSAAHAIIAAWGDLSTGGGTNFKGVPTTDSKSFIRNKLAEMTLVDNDTSATFTEDSAVASSLGLTVTVDNTGTDITATSDGLLMYNATDPTVVNRTVVITDITGDVVTVDMDVSDWAVLDTVETYNVGDHFGGNFNIPITGGSITIENNMESLVPEELSIVNKPLAAFTGERAISGSITAYLNTGAATSGGLIDHLLANSDEVQNDYTLTFNVGGSGAVTAASPVKVVFALPHAKIGIPSTNVEDVISLEIAFNGQSYNAATSSTDFESANEMTIQYLAQ